MTLRACTKRKGGRVRRAARRAAPRLQGKQVVSSSSWCSREGGGFSRDGRRGVRVQVGWRRAGGPCLAYVLSPSRPSPSPSALHSEEHEIRSNNTKVRRALTMIGVSIFFWASTVVQLLGSFGRRSTRVRLGRSKVCAQVCVPRLPPHSRGWPRRRPLSLAPAPRSGMLRRGPSSRGGRRVFLSLDWMGTAGSVVEWARGRRVWVAAFLRPGGGVW